MSTLVNWINCLESKVFLGILKINIVWDWAAKKNISKDVLKKSLSVILVKSIEKNLWLNLFHEDSRFCLKKYHCFQFGHDVFIIFWENSFWTRKLIVLIFALIKNRKILQYFYYQLQLIALFKMPLKSWHWNQLWNF